MPAENRQPGPKDRRRCTSHRRDGAPCRNLAMPGSLVCTSHDPVIQANRTPKVACKGHTKDGHPCRKAAWAGQQVCGTHGAKTPQAKRKAQERIAEGKAREVLARLDVAPVTNALEELQRVAGQVVAFKDVCARVVNKLRDTDLRYSSAAQLEQIRGEVQLWERSLDRAVTALTGLARVQVDERLTAIRERDRDDIARAVTAALTDLGLGAEDANKARVAFARHLRLIHSRRAA